MTGFPIAIGVGPRHSSSRQFPPRPRPARHNESSHNDRLETAGNSDDEDDADVIVAVGTNNCEDLMATVFIGYHFLPIPTNEPPFHGAESDGNNKTNSCSNDERESQQRMEQQSSPKSGHRYRVLAELRVQISPTTAPFVSCEEAHMSSRETRCRVPLGVMVKDYHPQNESHDARSLHNLDCNGEDVTDCNDPKGPRSEPISLTNEHANASVLISSNEAYLACLIPFPIGYSLAEGSSNSDWNEKYDTSKVTATRKPSSSTDATTTKSARSKGASILVVFSIQKNSFSLDQQWRQRKRVLPPLPDYIVEKKENHTDFTYDSDTNFLAGNTVTTRIGDFSRNNSFVSQSNASPEGTHHEDNIRNRSTLTEEVTAESLSSNAASSVSKNSEKASDSRSEELISYVAHEPKIVRVHTTDDFHLYHGDESTVFSSARSSKLVTETAADFVAPDSNPTGLFQRKPSFGGTFNDLKSTSPQLHPLRCATCICDIPFNRRHGDKQSNHSEATSMLLVGTVDGSVVLVDYSLSRVQSVLIDAEEARSLKYSIGNDADIENDIDGKGHDSSCNMDGYHAKTKNSISSSPVIHLSQCPPTQWKPLDIYGEDPGSESTGRIAVIRRDGSVTIYTTEFAKPPLPIESLTATMSSATKNLHSRKPLEHPPGVRRAAGTTNTKDISTRLVLNIRILAIFNSRNESNSDNPNLRYIRAKWLKPLILVLLTRSPLYDESVLTGKSVVTKHASSDTIVSQVWAVADSCCDESSKDETKESMQFRRRNTNVVNPSGARISLLSELRLPCGNEDAMEECAHDTFAMFDTAMVSTSTSDSFAFDVVSGQKDELILAFSQYESSMSISYHLGTDCLAISSSIVKNETSPRRLKSRPFVCLWDWKRCARGLTLISSTPLEKKLSLKNTAYLSLLHLGNDNINGLSAVQILEKVWNGVRQLRKIVFNLGTLSPPYVESSLGVDQPAAIILQHDSITFPAFGKSNTIDTTIQWEESRIPPSYISTNGPCRLAVIGKDCGKSIAVASSRGLCILDLSRVAYRNDFPVKNDRSEPCVEGNMCTESELNVTSFPRWKLFNGIRGEQSFRVVGMVWWERGAVGSTKGDSPDDLLLAVIKYLDGEPTQHLVCWSRKHLGFGQDQLLQDASDFLKENNFGVYDLGSRPGIPLPFGFRVDSISIVRDPSETSRGSEEHGESNRAILLCSHTTCKHGGNCVVLYSVFQLQTKQSPSGNKSVRVLGRLALKGSIPLVLKRSQYTISMDSVNGVFIAGGSFLFHLEYETEPECDLRFSITLGITTVFEGLITAKIDCKGSSIHCPLMNEATTIVDNGLAPLIAAFWLMGNMTNYPYYNYHNVWLIGTNDGTSCSWSVPCIEFRSNEDSFSEVIPLKKSNDEKQLCVGMGRYDAVGDVHHIGQCSLWMNGPATNENEIATGPFNSPHMSCTLYSGQMARKIDKMLTSYHISDCIVAPPPETPVIFLSFLKITELLRMSADQQNISFLKDFIRVSLSNNIGSTFASLRLVAMKVVDLLSQSKHSMTCTDDSGNTKVNEGNNSLKWTIGRLILVELVSVVKEISNGLSFASFFLSIGRQLEPHQFSLIFPLPSNNSSTYQNESSITVEELFESASSCGSLGIAVSALPLFSSHSNSQEKVAQLLCHCLAKIKDKLSSLTSFSLQFSKEEEIFLHQLFWFGVKLEDAIELLDENGSRDEPSNRESIEGNSLCSSQNSCDSGESDSSSDDSYEAISTSLSVGHSASDSSGTDHTEHDDDSLESYLLVAENSQLKRGIVSKVVSLFRSPKSSDSVNIGAPEEVVINEAASSFIRSGFHSPVKWRPQLIPVESTNKSTSHDDSSDGTVESVHLYPLNVRASVAGIMSVFIGDAIGLGRKAERYQYCTKYGWKAITAVAHLIQGDRETSAISEAGSQNAANVARLVTEKELVFAADRYPISEGVEMNPAEKIGLFLRCLIDDCEGQVSCEAMNSVFNLVLLLLLRYEMCEDVRRNRTSLVLVGVVAGHLGGRLGELIDTSTFDRPIHTIVNSEISSKN
ncbi:hypothetical protein ACHAXS_013849 [Conticribra weissflogii]